MTPNRSARMIRATMWSLGSDALAKAALLGSTVIVARALGSAQFGRYIALVALGAVAAAVWDMGLTPLVTREFAATRVSLGAAARGIARARVSALPLWLAVFGGGLFAIGGTHWGSEAVVLFGLASILLALHSPLLGLLRAQSRFRTAGFALAGGRGGTALLLLAAFVADHSSLTVVAGATAAGEGTTLVAAVLCLNAGVVGTGVAAARGSLRLRDGLPLAANGVLSIAYNRLDVVLVPALATASQLSRYAPASRVQDALYMLPYALGVVALPLLSRYASLNDHDQIRDLVRRMLVGGVAVAVLVSAIVSVFAKEVLVAVGGSGFGSAVVPTQILVWFLPLAVIQAPLIAYLIAVGRAGVTTRIIAWTFAAALVAHCALDWRYGAIGGAAASLSRDLIAAPLAIRAAAREGFRFSVRRSLTGRRSEVPA